MDRSETILKKGGDGSLYLEDRRTTVIQVTGFSNANEDTPSRFIHIENDESLNVSNYTYTCVTTVYPNGLDDSSKHLVFLGFVFYPRKPLYCRTHESINCRAEWTCLVSIVDSEGRLRYPQSLTLMYDGVQKSEYNEQRVQIVSADSLLGEADVLLPDDTLTIQVDMVLKQYYAGERCKHEHITFDTLMASSFERGKTTTDGNEFSVDFLYRRLRLHSPLGKLLRKESRYFERLCATAMIEKNSGYLDIPEEERLAFKDMVHVLSHLHVESIIHSANTYVTIKRILDVYQLSHIYGIETVLDTCRCWLRLICRSHFSCVTEDDVLGISELAETYDDPILRELVGVFARNEGKTEMRSGVEQESWICRRFGESDLESYFGFELLAKIKKEHVTADVSALSHCYV